MDQLRKLAYGRPKHQGLYFQQGNRFAHGDVEVDTDGNLQLCLTGQGGRLFIIDGESSSTLEISLGTATRLKLGNVQVAMYDPVGDIEHLFRFRLTEDEDGYPLLCMELTSRES